MIKLGENNFLLADADGSERPFSAAELQGELIYCFLSAGLRDSSCFAEDIALAVEYSLHEKYDFNGKINVDELSVMVVETLENAGFFTVADWFKRRNGRRTEELYPVTEESLHDIAVKQGILFSSGAGENALKRAVRAFELLETEKCPMGLIIEMLRYFYRLEKNSASNGSSSPKMPFENDYIVEVKEVADEFPEFLQQLGANDILKTQNITVYHPSIRLFLDCGKYAEFSGLDGVMTEMIWLPHASKLAQSMDCVIEIMQQSYNKKCGTKILPVYLTVNNLESFMEKYFGVASGSRRKSAKILLESLSSEMFYDFFRVRF